MSQERKSHLGADTSSSSACRSNAIELCRCQLPTATVTCPCHCHCHCHCLGATVIESHQQSADHHLQADMAGELPIPFSVRSPFDPHAGSRSPRSVPPPRTPKTKIDSALRGPRPVNDDGDTNYVSQAAVPPAVPTVSSDVEVTPSFEGGSVTQDTDAPEDSSETESDHDLRFDKKKATRASIMDNMLLSLDQIQVAPQLLSDWDRDSHAGLFSTYGSATQRQVGDQQQSLGFPQCHGRGRSESAGSDWNFGSFVPTLSAYRVCSSFSLSLIELCPP